MKFVKFRQIQGLSNSDFLLSVQFFQPHLLFCSPISHQRDASKVGVSCLLPSTAVIPLAMPVSSPTGVIPAPCAGASLCVLFVQLWPGLLAPFGLPMFWENRPWSVTYIPGSRKHKLVLSTSTVHVQRSPSCQAIHCALHNLPVPVIIINQFLCHS